MMHNALYKSRAAHLHLPMIWLIARSYFHLRAQKFQTDVKVSSTPPSSQLFTPWISSKVIQYTYNETLISPTVHQSICWQSPMMADRFYLLLLSPGKGGHLEVDGNGCDTLSPTVTCANSRSSSFIMTSASWLWSNCSRKSCSGALSTSGWWK